MRDWLTFAFVGQMSRVSNSAPTRPPSVSSLRPSPAALQRRRKPPSPLRPAAIPARGCTLAAQYPTNGEGKASENHNSSQICDGSHRASVESAYVEMQLISLKGVKLQVAWLPIQDKSFAARVHHQVCGDAFSCARNRKPRAKSKSVD